MVQVVRRAAALCVAGAIVIGVPSVPRAQQSVPAIDRRITYILPQGNALTDSVASAQAQVQELRSQQARPAKAGVAAVDGAAVHAALARHRLAESQPVVETKGENRTRLHLPRAPFFAIWPLFQTLQTENGIRIVSLRIDKLDASNARVEAMLAAGDR